MLTWSSFSDISFKQSAFSFFAPNSSDSGLFDFNSLERIYKKKNCFNSLNHVDCESVLLKKKF